MIKVAVDCMGGDHGLKTTIPAAQLSLERNPNLYLLLFGNSKQITELTHQWPVELTPRYTVVHTDDIVDMGEPAALAYRKKRNSSMRKAIDAVKLLDADATVSSGNTGALVLTATLVLRPIEGLERPAIAAYLPTNQAEPVLMLDLGANSECSAYHLQQFAIMGSALAQANGINKPRIGLLNIGEELGKGNSAYKNAYDLISNTPTLHFYGNVEGTDIYKRTVDVVVCDGFVGNIALKTSEGLASMIKMMISEEFKRCWWTKVLATLAYPVLHAFKKRIDHRRFNGALLLGLKGVVVKSHGSADARSFSFAINRAYEAADSRLIERLHHSLATMTSPSILEPTVSVVNTAILVG
jgi:phosphate acyltransferase